MAELVGAAQIFDSTLKAFVDGGATVSAEGKEVTLKALNGKAREIAVQALARWDSVSGPLLTENGDPIKARENLMAANAELLDLMNKMTVAIESASKDSVENMKMVQYGLFSLAVLLGIVVFVSLRAEAKESADQTGSLYAAMDEVAAGVLVLDASGKIRHHNKAALIFLSMEGGASPIGKPMAALMEETSTPGLWKVARSGNATHSVHVSTSEPIEALNGLRVATLFHSGLR